MTQTGLTMAADPDCPICGAKHAHALGRPRYRYPTTVAGIPIELSDLPLNWHCCSVCTFQFIHPPIPRERLLNCYAAAASSRWWTDERVGYARYYSEKKRALDQFCPGAHAVLDLGCFDGGFLGFLGEGYNRYGIEPSADAAKTAAERGIMIAGSTLEQAANLPPMDAVVSFDVFEHLNNPMETLRALSSLVRPGGIVMIETGDSDAPIWRWMGLRYPYAAYVEHVALFNERSLRAAGERAGLELVYFERTHHHRIPWRVHLGSIAHDIGYAVLAAWNAIGLPMPAKLRQIAEGPLPRVGMKDHFLAVLKSPA